MLFDAVSQQSARTTTPAATAAAGNSASAVSLPQLLPPLAWLHVLAQLDRFSKRQLALTSRLFCSVIRADMSQLALTACDLRTCNLDWLAESPRVSSLCITAPRRPIALSRLNERRRCEQQLAVFFDNISCTAPCHTFLALDISTAISHISCTTLQLLVDSMPHLHHLSLPAVATCGDTASVVLQALQQLPHLCACELDCKLFADSGSHSSNGGSASMPQPASAEQLQPPSAAQQMHGQATETLAGGQACMASMLSAVQASQQDDRTPLLLLPAQQAQHKNLTMLCTGPEPHSSSPNTDDYAQLHKLAASSAALTSSSMHVHEEHRGSWEQPTSSTCNHSSSFATHTTCSNSKCSHSTCSCGESRGCPGSPCSAFSAAPWSGLCGLKQLQHLQLQHLGPSSMAEVLVSVSHMPSLLSLSLAGLSTASASALLSPVAAGSGRNPGGSEEAAGPSASAPGRAAGADDGWLLAHLRDLHSLTRLEIRVDPHFQDARSPSPCGSTSAASQQACLVLPAVHTCPEHDGSGGPSLGVECAWSSLQGVQELVLLGICLDSAALAATLPCQQLTALHVASLDLHLYVAEFFGCSAGVKGLLKLKTLTVDQYFDMGANTAAQLMPELRCLTVQQAGKDRPDLRCLQHHQHLSSLIITAPKDSSWGLHTLQLGHLVHLDTLQELCLADASSEHCSTSCGGGGGSCSRPVFRGYGSGYRCVGASSSRSGSHWLPNCTGSLSQVTSLELSGPVSDHALGQLPGLFPGVQRLTVDGSYFASDGGLQKLSCAPSLQLLVLHKCRHITEYGLEVLLEGGGVKVVAVQGCAGINERACHHIRKACRYTGAQLLWYGPDEACDGSGGRHSGKDCQRASSSALHDDKTALATAHSTAPGHRPQSPDCTPPGSAFLQRCWLREQQQQQQQQQGPQQHQEEPHCLDNPMVLQAAGCDGPTAAVVAAATAVWRECVAADRRAEPSRTSTAYTSSTGRATSSRANGTCLPTVGLQSGVCWGERSWKGGAHALAH